jgi:hypothetical protein
MENIMNLIEFIDLEIKDNLQEIKYIELLNLVAKIVVEKEIDIKQLKDEIEELDDNDIYTSY